jgi:hypothetical protein
MPEICSPFALFATSTGYALAQLRHIAVIPTSMLVGSCDAEEGDGVV